MKCRVLFVAHSAHQGGAELCLDTTLRCLDRDKFDVDVVFPFEGPMTEAAREMGFEIRILPLRHWVNFGKNWWYWKQLAVRTLPNVLQLASLIRKRRVQLVYTNTASLFEPALAARLAGVPHVWHIHEVLKVGNRMHQLLPMKWIQRFIRGYSSLVIFESLAAQQTFEETTPLDRVEVIHNSLRFDLREPHDTRDEARQKLGLTAHDNVIGFLGQYIDRKNPMLLIRALAELAAVPDLVAVFAGEGELEGEMRQLADGLGVASRCRFMPFQQDASLLLSALDVLVLPSRQESFGLVLIEAAAFSKPVVACRSQGPDEIVLDGETGYLVTQNDVLAMAGALRQLIQSPTLRTELGTAGRQRVQEMFDPIKNTRQLEDVLDSFSALPGSRPDIRHGTSSPAESIPESLTLGNE